MRPAVWIAIITIAIGASVSAQSLQEQALCSAQAKTTFQEDAAKDQAESNKLGMHIISFDYQSHYNTKIKRCLILTTQMYDWGGEISTSKNLYDAFERRDYAGYLWTSKKDKKYWEVPPVSCELTLSYGQTKSCKSEAEFNGFVAEYMEQ
jgi:hypothetical protein